MSIPVRVERRLPVSEKEHILTLLQEEFDRWEARLAAMDEEQITDRQTPGERSIKDVVAHLWAWQQRSNARMQAALRNREPEFPDWPEGLDPDAEEDADQINEWIYQANRDRPWTEVHRDWRTGFLRLIELGHAVPEEDLLEPGKYAWFYGHPLALVLTASREHHEEHRDEGEDLTQSSQRE
jgi:hypothetical protein